MKTLAMVWLFQSGFVQATQRTPSPNFLASVELNLVQKGIDKVQKMFDRKLYKVIVEPLLIVSVFIVLHLIIIYEIYERVCCIANDAKMIRLNLDRATERIIDLQSELLEKNQCVELLSQQVKDLQEKVNESNAIPSALAIGVENITEAINISFKDGLAALNKAVTNLGNLLGDENKNPDVIDTTAVE